MNFKILAMTAVAVSAIAGAAGATTLGDTVSSSYRFSDVGALYNSGPSFTVADGVLGDQTVDGYPILESYSHTGGSETYTFTLPTIDFNGCCSFNGIVLSDLTGANFGSITSVSGLPFANVASTGGELQVNWSGYSFNAGDTVSVTFGAGVPEPAAWALMLMGFGAMGLMLRRDRKDLLAA